MAMGLLQLIQGGSEFGLRFPSVAIMGSLTLSGMFLVVALASIKGLGKPMMAQYFQCL